MKDANSASFFSMHEDQRSSLPIDETLTPQNAHERGYQWICNVGYDETEKLPSDLLRDFQRLLTDGYTLGCALHPASDWDKGLYEPLSE